MGSNAHWEPYVYPYTYPTTAVAVNRDVWAVATVDGLTIFPGELEALRHAVEQGAGVRVFRVVFGALIPVGGEREQKEA